LKLLKLPLLKLPRWEAGRTGRDHQAPRIEDGTRCFRRDVRLYGADLTPAHRHVQDLVDALRGIDNTAAADDEVVPPRRAERVWPALCAGAGRDMGRDET
jgi:hypothetical protein